MFICSSILTSKSSQVLQVLPELLALGPTCNPPQSCCVWGNHTQLWILHCLLLFFHEYLLGNVSSRLVNFILLLIWALASNSQVWRPFLLRVAGILDPCDIWDSACGSCHSAPRHFLSTRVCPAPGPVAPEQRLPMPGCRDSRFRPHVEHRSVWHWFSVSQTWDRQHRELGVRPIGAASFSHRQTALKSVSLQSVRIIVWLHNRFYEHLLGQ